MGRMARSCTQSVLKAVNYAMGMFGVAMILYAVWMLRVWLRDRDSHHTQTPWFTYTVLGFGVLMCLITCWGHVAAETASGCCLYIYMVLVFLVCVFEAAVTADVLLNDHWEEDFPEDPTENLDKLKDFIKNNFDICKWIGFTVVALQGMSILLGIILKALGPHALMYYESDDDYLPERVPLLKSYVPHQSYNVVSEQFGPTNRFSEFENQPL